MLHETWKSRLIRFAHHEQSQSFQQATEPESPRIILGKKIYKRQNMSPATNWLSKIKGEVRQNEMLYKHTSLLIGGPADIFILPKDKEDILTIFKFNKDLPVFFLGEGSNLLAPDKGFRGIVISMKDGFKAIKPPLFFRKLDGEDYAVIKAGAGVKMSYLAKYAAKYSLSGLEGLAGIPGSLGGSLMMNAGAEGTEIGDMVRSITRVTPDVEIQTIKRDGLVFEYRKTIFPPGGGVIVEAELELKKEDRLTIQDTIDRNLKRRNKTQPLTVPNSGSVFKNPEGTTAGRLIESAGLKGFSIDDAGVSIKHANFIVNKGEAKSEDVIRLIGHIQSVVKEKTGTELETEIVIMEE